MVGLRGQTCKDCFTVRADRPSMEDSGAYSVLVVTSFWDSRRVPRQCQTAVRRTRHERGAPSDETCFSHQSASSTGFDEF